MKHMRKVFALALTLIMALALTVPTFATEIEITGGNTGATYEAYRIMDLTTSYKNGTDATDGLNYAYTVNSTYRSVLQTIVANASKNDPKPAASDITDTQILAYASAIADKSDDSRAFAEAIFAAVKNMTADATSTSAKFSNVPQGYYLIVETADSTTSANGVAKSLVMLDTAGLDKVQVASKQDSMELIKKIVDGSALVDYVDVNIGDTVTFKLTSTLPSDLKFYDEYTFTVTDTLSAGLNFTGFTSVKIGDTDLTGNFASATGVGTIDLTPYIDEAADGGKTVEITYTAILNSSAVIGNNGNNNTAYLTFSDDPNHVGTNTTPVDEVVVFTYELDATKVAANDSTLKLAGAEFKLYRETADGTKEYVVLENGKVKSWGAETAGTVLTSDANGAFAVPGLDVGTYYLVETKAPEGYNLLAAPVKVDIAATYTSDEAAKVATLKIQVDDEVDKDENEVWADGNITTGVVTVTIENSTGMELPSTGGIGTTIFYMVGGILMAGAAILLITKKKMSNEQ